MKMKVLVSLFLSLFLSLLTSNAWAQFTGPGTTGREITVTQVAEARLGSYVTVTGNIVAHQRQDYFTFRDGTGEIRVEIDSSVWQNRKIDPETKVRLLAEIGSGPAGQYLWVKSLQVVD
jgi:uncharacterized protein (TIGR00156 family)